MHFQSVFRHVSLDVLGRRLHIRWRELALLLSSFQAVLLLSCEAGPADCDVRSRREALINGVPHAEQLQLNASQEAAVVQIRLTFDQAPFDGDCSGVLVAERSVLTAQHCLQGVTPREIRVVFGPSAGSSTFETASHIVSEFAEEDVTLLELVECPGDSIEVSPLPPARSLPNGFAFGSAVQIAGFGLDAAGQTGRRAFLTQKVESILHDEIVVGDGGQGGACFGDSGGPLLIRGDNHQVRTLGILGSGSLNCSGRDAYTRLDMLTKRFDEFGFSEPNDLRCQE